MTKRLLNNPQNNLLLNLLNNPLNNPQNNLSLNLLNNPLNNPSNNLSLNLQTNSRVRPQMIALTFPLMPFHAQPSFKLFTTLDIFATVYPKTLNSKYAISMSPVKLPRKCAISKPRQTIAQLNLLIPIDLIHGLNMPSSQDNVLIYSYNPLNNLLNNPLNNPLMNTPLMYNPLNYPLTISLNNPLYNLLNNPLYNLLNNPLMNSQLN